MLAPIEKESCGKESCLGLNRTRLPRLGLNSPWPNRACTGLWASGLFPLPLRAVMSLESHAVYLTHGMGFFRLISA